MLIIFSANAIVFSLFLGNGCSATHLPIAICSLSIGYAVLLQKVMLRYETSKRPVDFVKVKWTKLQSFASRFFLILHAKNY